MQAVFTVATDVVGMSSATQDSPVVGQPWYDHATASYGITLQVTDISGMFPGSRLMYLIRVIACVLRTIAFLSRSHCLPEQQQSHFDNKCCLLQQPLSTDS